MFHEINLTKLFNKCNNLNNVFKFNKKLKFNFIKFNKTLPHFILRNVIQLGL